VASPLSSSVMSIREIRRRLREVYEASCHLRQRLPPESVHNVVLTIPDIAAFTGEHAGRLRQQRKNHPPKTCLGGCQTTDTCRAAPPCRRMDACLQRKLSAFFAGWDAGDLLKVRIGDSWKVLSRERVNPALAQMATAARQAVAVTPDRMFNMKIDMGSGAPRLRGR
jgi:hypothetical protein